MSLEETAVPPLAIPASLFFSFSLPIPPPVFQAPLFDAFPVCVYLCILFMWLVIIIAGLLCKMHAF